MTRRDRLPHRPDRAARTSGGSRSRTRRCHDRVMRQVAPRDEPDHGDGAEPRAPRLARHDGRRAGARAQQPGGRRPPRRRASWPRRSTAVVATLGRFVEAGIEREDADGAASRCSARRCDGAGSAHAARRARRRRRRGRAARASSRTLGVAEAWRVAEPLAAAGVDADWLERARTRWPATRRPPPCSWVAATLTARSARRRRCRSPRRGCRRSSARSRPTPTWTAASWTRSTCTRAWRPRSTVLGHKLKHTQIEVVRDYDRDARRS